MKVKDILDCKGSRVIFCDQENNVMEALAIYSANKVGSLIVVDAHEKILGIVSPRDVLLAVLADPSGFGNLRIKDVMTQDLIVATPNDKVSYIQALMTENRVRHIPIVEDGELRGLVSIGDIVKAQLTEKDVEIRYLKDYMEGKYPA